MLIRFFTKFYPNVPFKSNVRSIIKPKRDSWSFQEVEVSYKNQQRTFVGERNKPKAPGKEETATVKMPGFVHQKTINEEGYFTQKAKQKIEEMERKDDKPTLTNPEKNN